MLHGVDLTVTGRVQGVFLRAQVHQYAEQHGLGGFVKNQYDGSVQIQAIGTRPHLESLIDWVRSSPGAAEVKEVAVHWLEHPKATTGFSIIST